MGTPIEELHEATKAFLVSKGDTVPHYYDETALYEHTAPPRYVWVEGTYEPNPEVSKKTTNPPAIGAFFATLGVHCWAMSKADAWQLAENVYFAMKSYANNSVTLRQSGWLVERRT